jgi:hypothetical protein
VVAIAGRGGQAKFWLKPRSRCDYPGVKDRLQRQIAGNEAIFRDVNEAIRRGQWPGEDELIAFRCECGELGCSRLIEVTRAVYESVRANPRRFLVAAGHEIPGAEAVVEARGPYLVVEKQGAAGRVAEAADPRS